MSLWFWEQKSRRPWWDPPPTSHLVVARITIQKATNLNSEIHKSFCHFRAPVPRAGVKVRSWSYFPGAGSIRIRHRLQTGTDQLRTEYHSSSVIRILVLVLHLSGNNFHTLNCCELNFKITGSKQEPTNLRLNTTPRPSSPSSSLFFFFSIFLEIQDIITSLLVLNWILRWPAPNRNRPT